VVFIVVFEEFHDWFIFLEELQSFKAETVEIVMDFNDGFWSSLNHASLLNFVKKYTSSLLF
jgi:hypothetical protein